jgi:hypothetical protein
MRPDYLSYVLIVVIGIVVSTGVITKIVFGFNIDSDWFWFLTGVGLAFNGIIALKKQKKFDKKYKIIEK